MKLLFCYDGPIIKDEGGKYFSTAVNDEMLKRYDCIADEITLAIRVNKMKNSEVTGKYLPITKNVVECPNLSCLKGIAIDKGKCKKILKTEIIKSDVIIIRLPSVIGNVAVKIAEKYNKPYLIEMVGCPWDALWNYSIKGKLVAPVMAHITKKNVKNAKYVLYVTKKFLQKRYPTKGKSINCSNVILKDFNESILKDRLKKINKKDTIDLCTVAATDVKYKGQQYVIKAISKLNKMGYNYNYYIIGGGDNSYLRRCAEKNRVTGKVIFKGSIPHNKIFEMLNKIDIYIQPSKQEGLPRALIEAMSQGCLCLGAKTGGIPELIEKKYIFKKANYKQLIKILKNISIGDFEKQSIRNFSISKEYNRSILEKRRSEFFNEFVGGK